MSGFARPKVKVEIHTDLLCPWCYVGKKHLEMAAQVRPQYDIEMVSLPYILTNPHHQDSEKSYYEAIFGGEASAVTNQVQAITQAGEKVGLALKIDSIPFGVDSFLGHRLIKYSRQFGKANRVEDILFQYILEENRDISDLQILLQAAAEAGVPDAQQFLESDQDVEDVWLQDFTAKHDENVLGVPFYIFNGSYGVSGMQPMSALIRILDEVAIGATPNSAPVQAHPQAPLPPAGPSFPTNLQYGAIPEPKKPSLKETLMQAASSAPQMQIAPPYQVAQPPGNGGQPLFFPTPDPSFDFMSYDFPPELRQISHPDRNLHNPKFDDFQSVLDL